VIQMKDAKTICVTEITRQKKGRFLICYWAITAF